jgi:Leucine-rich repeat (LRR) protein
MSRENGFVPSAIDKLVYLENTLTDEEKNQVLTNLGGASDVGGLLSGANKLVKANSSGIIDSSFIPGLALKADANHIHTLTGYSATPGTVVSTDSVTSAISKLGGNQNSFSSALNAEITARAAGDLTIPFTLPPQDAMIVSGTLTTGGSGPEPNGTPVVFPVLFRTEFMPNGKPQYTDNGLPYNYSHILTYDANIPIPGWRLSFGVHNWVVASTADSPSGLTFAPVFSVPPSTAGGTAFVTTANVAPTKIGQFAYLPVSGGLTRWWVAESISPTVWREVFDLEGTSDNVPNELVRRNPAGGFNASSVELTDGLSVGGLRVNSFGINKGTISVDFPNEPLDGDHFPLFPSGSGTLALTSNGDGSIGVGDVTGLVVVNTDQAVSAMGDQLIQSLRLTWTANAGTFLFSTTKSTGGIITVKTSTGYARLINSNGTLGPQVGNGISNDPINLAIPGMGLHRPLGVISVAGGSFRNGNITSIECSGQLITAISTTGLNLLQVLSCYENYLTSFDGSGLYNLTTLSLNNNRLTSFDGSGLSNLYVLNLNNNMLTSFDGSGLTNLFELYINDNRLTSFTAGSGLTNLNTLYLDNNRLTSFDTSVLSGLIYLEFLYLGNNGMTSFTAESELPNLRILSINDNLLTSFDGSGLPILNTLYLGNNLLTSFDGSGSTNFEFLYLDNNRLTSFDGSGLSNLYVLNLNNNRLTSFDGSGLPDLQLLYLRNNLLTSFDTSLLSGSINLFELYLANNFLTSFDAGSALPGLLFLDLNNNLLTSFDGSGLSNLTNLRLAGNELTSIIGAGMQLSYYGSSYKGSDFSNNNLSASALDNFFGGLGPAGGILIVHSNPGSDSCDTSLATDLGYTVIISPL